MARGDWPPNVDAKMFADTHCHLCPGLDDGPSNDDEAIAMCQLAWNEGIRAIAITAHQNERWPNQPDEVMLAAQHVGALLDDIGCQLELSPVGEIVIGAETLDAAYQGQLLTYGNHGKHLLVEYPHNLFLDIRELVEELVAIGIVPVLAHAERYAELLHDERHLRDLIDRGCLIQLTSGGLVKPSSRFHGRITKKWLVDGLVHVVGSDAHSPSWRAPRMQQAFQLIKKTCGVDTAMTLTWYNGLALMRGEQVRAVPRQPRSFAGWF